MTIGVCLALDKYLNSIFKLQNSNPHDINYYDEYPCIKLNINIIAYHHHMGGNLISEGLYV